MGRMWRPEQVADSEFLFIERLISFPRCAESWVRMAFFEEAPWEE